MTQTWIDSAASPVIASLAEPALRALALAAITGVALALLRVRRTSVKLCVWTVVLAAAFAMPMLDRVVPVVPLRVLPAVVVDSSAVLDGGPSLQTLPQRAGLKTRPSIVSAVEPDGGQGLQTLPQWAGLKTRPSIETRPQLPSWSVVLLVVYLLGAVALLARAVIGWVAARRLARGAKLIEDATALAQLAALASSAGLIRAPRLAESDACVVPLTMGVVRPVILLPAAWREWPATTLEAVLMHELAHIARRDALTQSLALVHRAVFWFSPLGWWLRRHLMQLAEYASDEAVLAGGVDRTTYAEALMGFFGALGRDGRRAEWSALSASSGHVAMAQGSGPERRVARIIEWNGRSHRLSTVVAVAVVLVALLAAGVVAAIQPARATIEWPKPAEQIEVTATGSPTSVFGPVQPRVKSRPLPATPAPAAVKAPTAAEPMLRRVAVTLLVQEPAGYHYVSGIRDDEWSLLEDGVPQAITVGAHSAFINPMAQYSLVSEKEQTKQREAFVRMAQLQGGCPFDTASAIDWRGGRTDYYSLCYTSTSSRPLAERKIEPRLKRDGLLVTITNTRLVTEETEPTLRVPTAAQALTAQSSSWRAERAAMFQQLVDRAQKLSADIQKKIEIGTLAPLDASGHERTLAALQRAAEADASGSVTTANADMATAKARYADATRALDRTQKLFDVGLCATKEVDDALLAALRVLQAPSGEPQNRQATTAAPQSLGGTWTLTFANQPNGPLTLTLTVTNEAVTGVITDVRNGQTVRRELTGTASGGHLIFEFGDPVARYDASLASNGVLTGTMSVLEGGITHIVSWTAERAKQDDFTAGAHQANEPGAFRPQVISNPKPQYTPQAIRAKIQGAVEVEAIVEADGTVSKVRVIRSLDREYGLDDQAIAAAERWRFTPGTLNGTPVRFVVRFELLFTIR